MLSRLWSLCCSLKLAIVLATLVTALAMAGSLIIHFNPQVFASLDGLSLADWQRDFGSTAPLLSSWIYLAGGLTILLAVNTLCCFVDWLQHLRSRWRKTGEYLLHFGFVLLVFAYFWGSAAGDRRAHLPLAPGELQPLPFAPGHFLRLDAIEPVIGAGGYPVDIRHTVALLRGDTVLQSAVLCANTPMFFGDTVIVASGSGQQTYGFRVVLPDLGGSASLTPGGILPLLNNKELHIDALDLEAPLAPLLHLTLRDGDRVAWSGWQSLRQALPAPLVEAGFRHVVRAPLQRPYSELTINVDPGRRLALIASILISFGVCITLFSFYAKRRRGDRPDIA